MGKIDRAEFLVSEIETLGNQLSATWARAHTDPAKAFDLVDEIAGKAEQLAHLIRPFQSVPTAAAAA